LKIFKLSNLKTAACTHTNNEDMPVKLQNSKVFKVSTVYVRSFSLCSAAQYITNSKMQTVMKIEGS